MSDLKDDSHVSEYETPIYIFHFYFDLIFRQFNFLPMPECLNSFHLSKETNFHNYKIKHGGPSLVTALFHMIFFFPGENAFPSLVVGLLLTFLFCLFLEQTRVQAKHSLMFCYVNEHLKRGR